MRKPELSLESLAIPGCIAGILFAAGLIMLVVNALSASDAGISQPLMLCVVAAFVFLPFAQRLQALWLRERRCIEEGRRSDAWWQMSVEDRTRALELEERYLADDDRFTFESFDDTSGSLRQSLVAHCFFVRDSIAYMLCLADDGLENGKASQFLMWHRRKKEIEEVAQYVLKPDIAYRFVDCWHTRDEARKKFAYINSAYNRAFEEEENNLALVEFACDYCNIRHIQPEEFMSDEMHEVYVASRAQDREFCEGLQRTYEHACEILRKDGKWS